MSAPEQTSWESQLAYVVAVYELVAAGHRLLGDRLDDIETARRDVVAVIDRALAAGVAERDIDVVLARLAAGANASHNDESRPTEGGSRATVPRRGEAKEVPAV